MDEENGYRYYEAGQIADRRIIINGGTFFYYIDFLTDIRYMRIGENEKNDNSADVVFVEAETEPENRASWRILEKCGFVSDGEDQEGARFVLD